MWNCTTDKTEAVRCVNGTVEIQQCTGGCDVMPIGQDDVCHTDGTAMGDAGVSDPDADPGSPGDPGHGGGGCCSADDRTAPTSLAMLGVLLALRRRRKLRA